MYLRKNKVKVGEQRRTYLSVAHNVWWTGRNNKTPQSRPVVLASFGAEEKTDVALAEELVAIIESVSPRYGLRRGDGKDATMRLAREIRRIEPFLKLITRREFGFAECLPSENTERTFLLENLVRERLAIGEDLRGEEELLGQLQSQMIRA
ncbi:MAG: hypothetical protein ACPHRO_08025 [Nannocystaceae bacterium]